MKSKIFAGITIALVVSLSAVLPSRTGYSSDNKGYVSSNPKGCNLCHKPEAKLWLEHGHSKMLRPVENGKAPEGVKVTLPSGMTWADITYVIGGDYNNIRFTDARGYLVTGRNAQWSIVGNKLTDFMPVTAPGTLKFDDIKYYVVGWKASGTYEKGVNNEFEGIPGIWFENGVGCESCHGPGHEHAALGPKKMREMKKKDKKADLKIVMSKKSEICGECHKRNDDDKINIVSANFIESCQEYSEMKFNKHARFKVTCVACHDPHASVREKDGMTRKCEDCHKGKFAKPVKIAAMKNLSCEQCHMPFAARGAYDTMVQGYSKGDTRSHIFGITADPDYKLDDGTGHATVNEEGFVRLTVEMTCFACHQSGAASEKSREELLARAKKVH